MIMGPFVHTVRVEVFISPILDSGDRVKAKIRETSVGQISRGSYRRCRAFGEFHGKIRVIPTTEYGKDSRISIIRAYEVFGSQNDVIALCGADSCNLYIYNHDKVPIGFRGEPRL